MLFPNLSIIVQPMKCRIQFGNKKMATGAHSKKETENLHLFLKEGAKGILRRKSETHIIDVFSYLLCDSREDEARF